MGLSFKPDTDDMREAPSTDILHWLQHEGAHIRAYDPQASHKAVRVFKGIKRCKDAYDAARGAEALLILTEWKEFKELNLGRIKKLMKKPLIIDGRNIFEPGKMEKIGFKYVCIGRKKLGGSDG